MNIKFFQQHWFWLIIAIVIFLINQLPFLTDMRPVMYDEAWYANTAYHFSQGDGFLNSAVGSGGNANFLLPLLTGTMFRLFGCSLLTIRLTAVLCGVITLLFLHLCIKELKCSLKAEICVLAFFVSIALFNTIFRFGRPECASIMCVMAGMWFLLRYLREDTWANMIGLSISTFGATTGHPYALLFFAIAGCVLLIQTIRSRKWTNLAHLSVLLFSAILALVAIYYVSVHYAIEGESSMLNRFSIMNIRQALPAYLKVFFMSKITLYMVALLPVIIWCCWHRDNRIRVIVIVLIAYFILFPFLFSTDMKMIGLSAQYVVIVGTLLIAPWMDSLQEYRYKTVVVCVFAIYCVANLSLSYYYNYGVKYEKCNSVLEQDLKTIIPHDAIVYTPLRQYPFVMKHHCYSDHYGADLPERFDYIILNSQDMRYDNTIELNESLENYTQIYSRHTKSYGDVQVYIHN